MHDKFADLVTSPTPRRLLGRVVAGMSRLAMTGLVLLAIPLAVPLVGATSDWIAKHRESTTDGVRAFQWMESDAPASLCTGPACTAVTLALQPAWQIGGAGSAMVATRIRWPAPMVIEARPGTHMEVVGAVDALHPVVERPGVGRQDGDMADDTRPVLLANEVEADGRRRAVMVPSEGYVSAWASDDDATGQLIPWVRPADPDRRGRSQQAAIERGARWRALKMRRVQFQPVPSVIEVDVARTALLEPLQVGQVAIFDWATDGSSLTSRRSQLPPSHNAVGVVVEVDDMGEFLRAKVRIPRTSPYSGYWLWGRLDGTTPDSPVLPDHAQAVFFMTGAGSGTWPNWQVLENSFVKLPMSEVARAPAAALDPTCAEPAGRLHGCVWVLLHGVAVPLQVDVQPLPGGDLSLTERSAFAGKALRPADWAALSPALRSRYGSPSVPGAKPSRTLLDARTSTLLAPAPWLAAGLPVSVAGRGHGTAP